MSFKFTIHGECESPESERAVVEFLRRALVPLNGEGSPALLFGAGFEGSQAGNVNLLSNPEPVEEVVAVEVVTAPTVPWDTTVPDVLPSPVVSTEDQKRLDAEGPATVYESHAGSWSPPVPATEPAGVGSTEPNLNAPVPSPVPTVVGAPEPNLNVPTPAPTNEGTVTP